MEAARSQKLALPATEAPFLPLCEFCFAAGVFPCFLRRHRSFAAASGIYDLGFTNDDWEWKREDAGNVSWASAHHFSVTPVAQWSKICYSLPDLNISEPGS